MISERKVRDMYESKIRLFAKTGKDKYLDELMLLEKVLELPSEESDRLLNVELEKLK